MLGLVILETELKVIRKLVLLHSKDLPSKPAFHSSQGKKHGLFYQCDKFGFVSLSQAELSGKRGIAHVSQIYGDIFWVNDWCGAVRPVFLGCFFFFKKS